jgi:hypothetical protein
MGVQAGTATGLGHVRGEESSTLARRLSKQQVECQYGDRLLTAPA